MMEFPQITLAGLAAFVSGSAAILLVKFQSRLPLIDLPNQRSSHNLPKPRSGGIAIAAALTAVLLTTVIGPFAAYRSGLPPIGLLAAAVGFFLLGLADDYRPIPAAVRLLTQCALACVAVRYGGLKISGWGGFAIAGNTPNLIAQLLTILWIVGFVNIFNFMDGIDGIALGKAAIGGVLVRGLGGPEYAVIVAASAVGLLPLNFQPSRIFLGDGGSYLIGFLLASACAQADASSSFVSKALPFTSFLMDSGLTLFRRFTRGEMILEAHRSHYYQRATDLGLSHRTVALSDYALTLLGGLAGVFFLRAESLAVQIAVLGAWAVVLALPLSLIDILGKRHNLYATGARQ